MSVRLGGVLAPALGLAELLQGVREVDAHVRAGVGAQLLLDDVLQLVPQREAALTTAATLEGGAGDEGDGLAAARRVVVDLARPLGDAGGLQVVLGDDDADLLGAAAQAHRLEHVARVDGAEAVGADGGTGRAQVVDGGGLDGDRHRLLAELVADVEHDGLAVVVDLVDLLLALLATLVQGGAVDAGGAGARAVVRAATHRAEQKDGSGQGRDGKLDSHYDFTSRLNVLHRLVHADDTI